ncbi:glycosyltransferase family 2 protein [Ceraceosorus bombacis]|uniref:chitin synthase n=1 Tax=Ceraceosorus bombacis TaxID=401625 RepID=A0A0N7LAB2_9BASI|nr:glycosyltransferase family 2 protein [Ceraceosorus bombacis]
MNPFNQQPGGAGRDPRWAAQQIGQQDRSLPPLVIPDGGHPQAQRGPPPVAPSARQGQRSQRQNSGGAGGPMSPPARYSSPPVPYDDRSGGSFSHYASSDGHSSRAPLQASAANAHASAPAPAGHDQRQSLQRPPPLPQSVSFQEPAQRPHAQRSGASRDSVIKKDMGDRRFSGQSGVSDMPELRQVSSLGGGGAGGSSAAMLDPESGFSGANFRRKKSLVRPDRERMDPSHRQWYYRNHAAQMDAVDAQGRAAGFSYMPSTTGHLPQHGAAMPGYESMGTQGPGGGVSGLGMVSPHAGLFGPGAPNMPPGGLGRAPPSSGLRRGKSILGRDEDQVETGINILKRGVSLRRSRSQSRKDVPAPDAVSRRSKIAPGPVGPWMMYCYVITICFPGPCLGVFGIKTPEQQRAWREKIGILSIVAVCMAFVGFITFGFVKVVCDSKGTRYNLGRIESGTTLIHGWAYDFNEFFHPQVGPFAADTPYNHSNPAYSEPWSTGARDASNLFQVPSERCRAYVNVNGAQPDTYFPAGTYKQDGSVGSTNASWIHPTVVAQRFLRADNPMRKGQVSYSWDNITDPAHNLAVWKGSVLDLNRLGQLHANLSKPAVFAQLNPRNEKFAGRDVSAGVLRSEQDDVFDCLEDLVRVGFIDSETIGCVAADVELYIALVFILGVVAIKFFMAVIFGWFLSWRLGNYKNETYEERMKRAEEIEQWSKDIYRPAPAGYRPNVKKHRSFLPTTSRFSTGIALSGAANKAAMRTAMSEKSGGMRSGPASVAGGGHSPALRAGRLTGLASPMSGSPPGSPSLQGARSSASLVQSGTHGASGGSRRSSFSGDASPALTGAMGACPFPLHNVVPQPPADFQPFNFPLAHSICLVTAYSESFEGLRTTLDSLATTDYPNSHKLLLVVADGIVKGAGSEISTPDIVLSMMKDFVVPPEEVEGNSYVAIADGHKRHNMAKVYSGFYEYDDETVERSKQQRVPMVLVAKCGTPLEADSAKPGNRGKRDSQVMLMAFMQRVMFDERMTTFDYEFFNSIWRVTGVSPDHYEIVLMVDADTKVFPDSLTRMAACMIEDPEIMGLCGETKIANKTETWVTMIQVFEYYISHHQTKAFEACFGGVTCLPGCFSAYRIKAPKGPNGYWVPILANPDIVEHYSENVVDTLHKKNLLLLGEDRYLTTLMLKTFPKRKMMFVPQAVCKTIVPDTFRVLLSQRRRWINSTVHNLAELVLVNDLCGTFCFSMRFVVFMELAGTLVLPAAIAFTFYVVAQAFYVHPAPVIPLVLLAIILGLPGLLIVVTSRKLSYVGWMFIYLLSLPIWNFVFPSYAFWHMDDFSWGATRVVQGDKGGGHDDVEGKFDASNITMKRWAEFERDRRWRSGTHSRDSTYDVVHRTGSPERSGSTRYSMVSSDTFHSNPSGKARGLPSIGAPGSVTVPRPRDPSPIASSQSTSQTSLTSRAPYENYASVYSAEDESRPMMASGASSPDPNDGRGVLPAMAGVGLTAEQQIRHGSVSSEQRYPGLSEAQFSQGFTAEPEEDNSFGLPQGAGAPAPPGSQRPPRERPQSRGFSLVDDGPVASSQGVRQVQRGARRGSVAPSSATSPTGSNTGRQSRQNH